MQKQKKNVKNSECSKISKSKKEKERTKKKRVLTFINCKGKKLRSKNYSHKRLKKRQSKYNKKFYSAKNPTRNFKRQNYTKNALKKYQKKFQKAKNPKKILGTCNKL